MVEPVQPVFVIGVSVHCFLQISRMRMSVARMTLCTSRRIFRLVAQSLPPTLFVHVFRHRPRGSWITVVCSSRDGIDSVDLSMNSRLASHGVDAPVASIRSESTSSRRDSCALWTAWESSHCHCSSCSSIIHPFPGVCPRSHLARR